ncbi:lectin-like [Engraulis encrasicolus]|uniref:lectin-like n=1 Tax=Engraulis encrasicolus TaxID=184585 RepID=UPI002FD67676
MKIFQLMLVMTLGLAVLCDTPEDQEEIGLLSEPVLELARCSVDGFKDWYVVGSFCAKHFTQKHSFPDAEKACRAKHPRGHLISLHDGTMNNDVKALTRSQAWIGGYKLDCGRDWIWTDGSKWCYQNWVPGEPNNSGRCAHINWHTHGKFDDTRCCNRKTFICAFPLAQ